MAWHPEPKSLCWAWCQPESHGSTPRPRDAAALPPNPGAHEYRNAKSLWGHKAFRLVPVIYVGPGVGEMVLVQLEGSKVQIRTKPGLLLEWYEGLLVLDALMRSSEQCQWLESLAGRFQKERAQRKNLSASLYVSKKLLTIAVTGPQFVTKEGTVSAHRRVLRQDPCTHNDCLEEPGWYKVDRILDYMPPWESFVNPKFGLYQEFYLILWKAPHLMDSYSHLPEGCEEHPHATWEPDECLPDEFDVERVEAKKKWIEIHRERENTTAGRREVDTLMSIPERRPAREPPKRPVQEVAPPIATRLSPEKMAKVYHPDLSGRIRHGLRDDIRPILQGGEEVQIKQGWPKCESDYPVSYLPADPPGCCKQQCRCMEDWHIEDASKCWLDNQQMRNQSAQNAVDAFKSQLNLLRIRGQVSGQWYIEPNSVLPTEKLQQLQHSRRMALQVANLVHKAMGAVVIPLPLQAITEEGGGDILRDITILQDDEQQQAQDGGPFEPAAFEKVEGPDWLVVSATGHISTIAKDTPRAFKAETVTLQVDFIGADPSHRPSLHLQIGPEKPALPESLAAWTGQIMDKVRSTPTLSFALETLIKKVYDTESRGVRKKVTLALWLKTMKQVYIIARAAANSSAVRPGLS